MNRKMPKVSESSDDGWPAPTKRQPRVVPTSVHQPRESSNLMRAEISDVKHRRFELHYESDKNESAFRFQQKELAAANGQSLTKHDEQKSEMRPFHQSVSSFLDKQPRNDTMLYQETDLKAEDYYELEQKVALLKRVHRGEFILLNEDLTKDQLLLSALTWNMDFLNICETVVAPAPKYQGMDSSILPWRIENHAVYYDLIDFVQPGKDLPQMATPITFLEPQLLLCVGFDEKSNNKEQVQTTLKRILDDGFILDPLQEIVYGVKALWKCPDDGKYIRVVTLALDNNIGAREEAWVVTCLDSVCLERDKTFVVQGSELFVIPDQLSIKNIPAQLFIMQLRGLDHIREGYIADARAALDNYVDAKSSTGFVFMLHYDEESGLSIGDLLFLSPEESTFSYKFLADELYDAVKGNKSYWMTKGDAGELPIITDFEKRFSELLHVVWGDQIEPEVAPTQPLTVESTEERSLQEDVIAARTLADMGEIEIPEEVEEKNLELQKWNKYHKILRALLRNAQDKEFYRNALMLLKENSGVSNEDLDFVFTFLR